MKIPTNIDELKTLVKRVIRKIGRIWKKRILPFYRKTLASPYILYPAFIIIVSFICILPAEKSSHRFRSWYYDLTHTKVIDKGIEYEADEEAFKEKSTFLTYYRYQEFAASNPKNVDADAPMIALTFDDGPNSDYTKRILDVLNENYSRATFFVVGTNAELHTDTLKLISESGCEIGNHSYSHQNFTEIAAEEVESQIDMVNRAVKKATGEETTVIRPPYGAFNDDVLAQLEKPAILWDMDTEDWDSRNAQKIADKVLSEVKDGDIILMHDIYDSTAEAVEIIVPKLKEQGYQIVTVSELAQYKGKTLEAGNIYSGFKGEKQ